MERFFGKSNQDTTGNFGFYLILQLTFSLCLRLFVAEKTRSLSQKWWDIIVMLRIHESRQYL